MRVANERLNPKTTPKWWQLVGLGVSPTLPNSPKWQDALREARSIASECVRLAQMTGDENVIEEAERTLAISPQN
jgi:hypothetical protein